MFKGLSNFATMFKQAQQLGTRIQELTESLKHRKVEGTAGGGLVTVEVNGVQQVLKVSIDPSLLTAGDREFLEDLIVSATNNGLTKARELHAEAVKSLSGDIGLPGLDEAMSKFGGLAGGGLGGTGGTGDGGEDGDTKSNP